MKISRRTFLQAVTIAAAAAPAAAELVHHHHHQSHYPLYAKLDRHRRTGNLAKAQLPGFTALAVVPFEHPYFDFVSARAETPGPGCAPTCC